VSDLPDQPNKANSDTEVLEALADLVTGISRLLGGIAALPPFRNAQFSVAHWVALSLLSKAPPKNSRQLANTLGVTRQRANQIKGSLERSKLIHAIQSTQDARQKVLKVTSHGYAKLKQVNQQLEVVLASSLINKERVLVKAIKAIRMLVRSVRPGGGKTRQPMPSEKNPERRLTKMSRAGT
jgi:DNA-binding MarR family transcriptional regulator